MPNYKRLYQNGGIYFFTLVTHNRQKIFLDEKARKTLKKAILTVQKNRPFTVKAICLLPDHIHTIWKMPDGDNDFSTRWAAIKSLFINEYKKLRPEYQNQNTFWQKRFWEHLIRDREDFTKHLHYIHYNPVKHNLVEKALDWPWSTFHKFLSEGYYAKGWGKEQIGWLDNFDIGAE